MSSRRFRSLGLVGAVVAMVGTLVLPASAAPGAEQVDVIVVLDNVSTARGHEANRAEAALVARDHGISPTQTYGTALVGFAGKVPTGRLQGLRHDPRVAYVDLDAPVEAYEGAIPWGISRIGAPLSGNTGVGIHVYVLDTGIDSNHKDLAANIGNGHAVETCAGSGRRCRYSWDDDHGHGTHVAGTVAALDNDIDVVGVAPGATLHAVKVLSSTGSGKRSGVIAGIDWVTSEVRTNGYGGKAVVNMSLGGSGSKTGTCVATTDGTNGFSGSTDSYHQSICASRNAGVVFAVAAGNSGADAAGSVPAAYDDAVLTVSATTSPDGWPSWSNWGDALADWTTRVSAPVALAAPGAGVLSTAMDGGTTTKSGTSMAAPHVAGAVALYLKSKPQLADGTAFTNVRAGLLGVDESTDNWKNTSGYVHDEDFLDVRPFGTTGSTDVTEPSITLVAVENVTPTSAEVVWTTDESSTSTVRYSLDGVTASSEPSAALVQNHKVVLGGLESGRTYSYEVESVDAAGNTSTSTGHSFTTAAASTSPTLSVASELYSLFGGKKNTNHLDVTVKIVDGTSTSTGIADVAVTIELYDATTGKVYPTATATTGAGGDAIFQYRGIGPGCYSAKVIGASKSGYDVFDANSDKTNTSCP